jgi:hypothetical protein
VAGGRDFNRSKLKELVLYLSRASASDEGFGMVKLNKLLYRADTEAFRLLGESITGTEYLKQEFGPVAAGLQGLIEEMAKDELVEWRHYQRGEYVSDVPEAREDPDMQRFSPAEIEIIDQVRQELAPHGGKSVSDWSHEEWAGWRISGVGEQIPYETVVIASEPGPAKTVERLRQRALSGNWE